MPDHATRTTDEHAAQARALHAEGASYWAISRRTGLPYSRVRRLLDPDWTQRERDRVRGRYYADPGYRAAQRTRGRRTLRPGDLDTTLSRAALLATRPAGGPTRLADAGIRHGQAAGHALALLAAAYPTEDIEAWLLRALAWDAQRDARRLARYQRLADLWYAGATRSEIARDLDVTDGMCGQMIVALRRHGYPLPRRRAAGAGWLDDPPVGPAPPVTLDQARLRRT